MTDREATAVLTAALPLSQKSERLVEHYCADPAHIGKFELSNYFEDPKVLKSFALGAVALSTKPKSLPKEILGAKPAEVLPQPSDAITAPLLDFVMLALDRKEEPTPDVLTLLDSLRTSVKFLDPQNSAYSTQIRTKVKKVIQLGLAAAQRFRTNPAVTSAIFKSCVYLASIVGKMSLYLEILVKAAELNLLDEAHIPDFSLLAISKGTRFKIIEGKDPITGVIKQNKYDGHTLPPESHKHANTQIHFDHYRLLMDQGDYYTLMNRYPCPVTNDPTKENSQFSIIYQFRNSGVKIHTGMGTIWASQYSDIGVLANRNRGYSRVWNFNFNKHESMSTQQLDAKLRPIKPDFSNSTTSYHCGNHEDFFYRVSFFKSTKAGIADAVSKIITISKYTFGTERYAYQQALSEIPIKSDDNVLFGWPDSDATFHRVTLLNGLLVIAGHNKTYWIIDPATGTLFTQGILPEAINGIDYLRREVIQAVGTKLTYMPYEFFYQYSYFRQTLLKLNSDVSASPDKPQLNVVDILGLKTGDDSFEESDYEGDDVDDKKPTEAKPAESGATKSGAEPTAKSAAPEADITPAVPVKQISKESGKVFAAYLELLSVLAFDCPILESLEDINPKERNKFLTSFDGLEPIPATFNSLHSLLEFVLTSLKGHLFFDCTLISLLHLLKVHIDRLDLVQDRNTTGVRLVNTETLAKIGVLLLKHCPEPPTDISVDGKRRTVFLEPEELTFLRGWILAKIYLAGVPEVNQDGVLFKHLISYNVLFPRNLMKRVLRELNHNLVAKAGSIEEAQKNLLKDPTISIIFSRIQKAAELEKEVLPNHFTFENKQRPIHPELKYLQENLRPIISFLSDSGSPLFEEHEELIAAILEVYNISVESFKAAANLMRDHGSFGQDTHHDFGHFWLATVGMQLHQYLIKTPEKLKADISMVNVLSSIPESMQDYPEVASFSDQLNHIHLDVTPQKRHFCTRIHIDLPDEDFRIASEGAIFAQYFQDSPNTIVVWGYLHETSKTYTKPQLKIETYSGRSRRLFYQGYQGYLKKRSIALKASFLEMIEALKMYRCEVDEWNLLASENLNFKAGAWVGSDMNHEAVWTELLKLVPVEAPATIETPAEESKDPKEEQPADQPIVEPAENVLTTPPISPRGPPAPPEKPAEAPPSIEGALDKLALILKLTLSAEDKTDLVAILKRKSEKQQWNWILLWAHLPKGNNPEEQASTVQKMKRSGILFSSTRIIELALHQQHVVCVFTGLVDAFVKMNDPWKKNTSQTCHMLASIVESEKDIIRILTSGRLLVADTDFDQTLNSLQTLVNEFSTTVYQKVTSDYHYDYLLKLQYYSLAGVASLSQNLGAAIKFDVTKILMAQTRLKEIGNDGVNKYLRIIASRTKQGWQYLCENFLKMKPADVCDDPEQTDAALAIERIPLSGDIPSYVWKFLNSVSSTTNQSQEVKSEVFETPDQEEYIQENCLAGYPEKGTEGGELTEILEAIRNSLNNESEESITEMVNSKHLPLAKFAELLVSPDSVPKVFIACSEILVKVSPYLNREESRTSKVLKDTLELLAGSLERYFSCISQRTYNRSRKGSPSAGIFLQIIKAYAALKSPSSLWLNELQPSILLEAQSPLPELAELQKLLKALTNSDTPQFARRELLKRVDELLAQSIHPSPIELSEWSTKKENSGDGPLRGAKLALVQGTPSTGLFEKLRQKVYSGRILTQPAASKVPVEPVDITTKIQRQTALEALLDFSTDHEMPGRKLIKLEKDKPHEKLNLSAYEHWILIAANGDSRICTSTLADPASCYLKVVDDVNHGIVTPAQLVSQVWGLSLASEVREKVRYTVASSVDAPPASSETTTRTFILIPDPSRLHCLAFQSLLTTLEGKSPKHSSSRTQRLQTLTNTLHTLLPTDALPRLKPLDINTLVHVYLGSGLLLREFERRAAALSVSGDNGGRTDGKHPVGGSAELSDADWLQTCGCRRVDEIVRYRRLLQCGHVGLRGELLKIAGGAIQGVVGQHSANIWVESDSGTINLDIGYTSSFTPMDAFTSEFLGATLGNLYLMPTEDVFVNLSSSLYKYILNSELDLEDDLKLFTNSENETNQKQVRKAALDQTHSVRGLLKGGSHEKVDMIDQLTEARKKVIKQSFDAIRRGFYAVVGDLLAPTETPESLKSYFANTPPTEKSASIPAVTLSKLIRIYQDAKLEQPQHSAPIGSVAGNTTATPAQGANQAGAAPAAPPPPPEEEEEISLGGLFD